MLDPLSPSLLKLLSECRLCKPRDLRRCRSRVAQLTKDLPAFDSVWLDALVQQRVLTPFQATLLESDHPERIRVGPYLLVDRVGPKTFRGRTIGTRTQLALKLLPASAGIITAVASGGRAPPDSPNTAAALNSGATSSASVSSILLQESGGSRPPLAAAEDEVGEIIERFHRRPLRSPLPDDPFVAPFSCEHIGNHLVLASRFVPGKTLSELVIRRGRFPARHVVTIARQLALSLAALEHRGQAHGDLRLANVRLCPNGQIVPVDAGVLPLLSPVLKRHALVAPEHYDGIAPELIGTGQSATTASDTYALGSLLWQLLAGRAPYPGGDPLAKLAFHQSQRILDVRELAPDTPKLLAETILACTNPNPERRPKPVDLIQKLPSVRRSELRAVGDFVRRFDSPLSRDSNTRFPWKTTAATLLAGAGSLGLLYAQHPPSKVWIDQFLADAIARWKMQPESTTLLEFPLLPSPNGEGIIELEPGKTYLASTIATVGNLTIRSQGEAPARIVVKDKGLSLTGDLVTLEGVDVELDPEAVPPLALVTVRARGLIVRRSSIRGYDPDSREPTASSGVEPASIGIACQVMKDDPHGGKISLEDSWICVPGAAFFLTGPVRELYWNNGLHLGTGPTFHLAKQSPRGLRTHIKLENVTLRQVGSLVRWEEGSGQPALTVQSTHSVLDLDPNQGALFEWYGESAPPRDWLAQVQFEGIGTVAPASVPGVAFGDLKQGVWKAMPDEPIEIEGITSDHFEFVGKLSSDPAYSVIAVTTAPTENGRPPGFSWTPKLRGMNAN